MQVYNVLTVSRHLHLKRNSEELVIPPGEGLSGCLESAVTVARYFLQELGLSPELARIMPGCWRKGYVDHRLAMGLFSGNEPVLAIDDLAIFPTSLKRVKWLVVAPMWHSMEEEPVVRPLYNVEMHLVEPVATLPLYQAVMQAIQTVVVDGIRQQMHAVLQNYFNLLALPETDEEYEESRSLAVPALEVLLRHMPCLVSQGRDQVEIRTGARRTTIHSPLFYFEQMKTSGLWSAWYASPTGWTEIDPLVEASSTAQKLARRDFLGVFYRTVPVILARKIREIERPLVVNKTWR